MAGYFVDSSALVKRYVNETGSVWLSGLISPAAGNDIYIARITTVEVIVALTRRAHGGTITAADASAACLLFRNDLSHDDQAAIARVHTRFSGVKAHQMVSIVPSNLVRAKPWKSS